MQWQQFRHLDERQGNFFACDFWCSIFLVGVFSLLFCCYFMVRHALAPCHYYIRSCMRYLSVWHLVIFRANDYRYPAPNRHTKWISTWAPKKNSVSIRVCVPWMCVVNNESKWFFFVVAAVTQFWTFCNGGAFIFLFTCTVFFNFISQSSVCRLNGVCVYVCMLIIAISNTILTERILVCIWKCSDFCLSSVRAFCVNFVKIGILRRCKALFSHDKQWSTTTTTTAKIKLEKFRSVRDWKRFCAKLKSNGPHERLRCAIFTNPYMKAPTPLTPNIYTFQRESFIALRICAVFRSPFFSRTRYIVSIVRTHKTKQQQKHNRFLLLHSLQQ